jgi:hypothetical protein
LDFEKKGCSVCRIARIRAENWVWHILYECTGDPEVRDRFDRSLGLCGPHAHLMLRVAKRHPSVGIGGVARMYESVLAPVQFEVEAHGRTGSSTELWKGMGAWFRNHPTPPSCMLCTESIDTARGQLYFLLQALREEPDAWKLAFEHSDGLCVPHIKLALNDTQVYADPSLRAYLVSDQRRRMNRLAENLAGFLHKQSYNAYEPIAPGEAAATEEAIWRLNGMEFPELLWREEPYLHVAHPSQQGRPQ